MPVAAPELLIKADSDQLKNVRGRTTQLALIALVISFCITVYYIFLGLTLSAVMLGVFVVVLGVIMLLHIANRIKQAQLFVMGWLCILLMVSGFIEGAQTGQYFYFFPLIAAVPLVINPRTFSRNFMITAYLIVVLSFSACFTAGNIFSPVEPIPPGVAHQMLFTNAAAAMLVAVAFSTAYIYYEKKYMAAILAEQHNTITEKAKFLATMGHELRTPLNGIIGALSLFRDEKPELAESEYYPVLKYCANHMRQLVNDILDYNKIEAAKLTITPVNVNLREVLLSSTLPFYNEIESNKLQLMIDVDPQLDLQVKVDDVRLIQVINNLLSNAMKFTEEGYIKLGVHVKEQNDQAVTAAFFVEDSGIGIAREDQQKIFEGFWQVYNESTRKQIGTGLGLTICSRLLELMGSKLHLQSEPGKGSVFSFDLTLDKVQGEQKRTAVAQAEHATLADIKILIVEDNQINMMIARKILTGQDAVCDQAFNGREAVDMIEAGKQYDIILLDLEMPVMDGYTAIAGIRRIQPHTPVLAVTASLIDPQMLSHLLALGFTDCVLKPFQPIQLVEQIKRYLNGTKKEV